MARAMPNPSQGFDETSNIWLQPFSALINCMFPVEYVYADWYGWQADSDAKRADPECLICPSEATIEAGSRVEGFCIPQFLLRKSDIEQFSGLDIQEHWRPDLDTMTASDPFVKNKEGKLIPIFTVDHVPQDPKYAKLRLTKEWKEHRTHYKNISYLQQTFLLPSAEHAMAGCASEKFDGQSKAWTYDLHGPVRKLESGGFPSYEEDQTGVFKYPDAWPEPAKEWLVRVRPSGWPSAELVQEIFDSGCHLAPVGRGKRVDEPVDLLSYCQNPEFPGARSAVLQKGHNKGELIMDDTEWKTSFSVAENKLGMSVSPVQRHIMVVLKMIKKCYFPRVISTYCLKHLLFWESEKKQGGFWREDNSANCLLLILDRLQECLEAQHLPHFFIPRSNILQYEDPSKMNEAAAIVAEVRRDILPKTVNMLKRLQSLTYLSSTYLQGLGSLLEEHLLKMLDRNLSGDDHRQLLSSLHSVFVVKCKNVLADLLRITPADRQKIDKLINVSMYVYQSMLARTLCKVWFFKNDENNDYGKSEEDFKMFVEEEVKDFSFDDEFLALVLVFFDRARSGMEPSLAIPGTKAMDLLREEQLEIAMEGIDEVHQSLTGTLFDWLKRSDLKRIEEKVTKKLRDEVDFITVTREEIVKFVNEELAALYEERIK